ncbi:hypothetical protein [Leptolyngbya sp. NIES-2104]|uniref:hypothetical protein n=1 Tax=Leptolyngbya sp. NIES-2104 TaxID=1552121 RepID=UPI0006ECB602|nr:hypothetical protein [Leptolyngbya sp. NIES-2104]GAP95441.1 hypothetical protein NIES2104_19630 [Leptolyngbya sp. NIES-2104]
MAEYRVLGYFLYGGDEKYKLELFFSILSALKQLENTASEIRISVVTDQIDFDPDLPIDILHISSDELVAWTDGGAYNHRAKCFALKKLLEHYQCPVVMVDTDTYFLNSPSELFDRISPTQTVMHCKEVDAIENHSLYQPFLPRIGNGLNVQGINVTRHSPMYNSGVIGVDSSHLALIDQSIEMLNEIYRICPIFNVEQLSIGLVLNQKTTLSTSDDIVAHYWGYSRYFIHVQSRKLFTDFSAKTLEKLLKLPFPAQLGYPEKSLRDKLITSALSKLYKWDDDYRFAYLSYRCAFSYASQDEEYANVWAKIAIESLKRSNVDRLADSIRRDFRRLRVEKLDRVAWLHSETKDAWREVAKDQKISGDSRTHVIKAS